MSWPAVSIEELCSLVTDGTHYSPPEVPNGIPFLTVKDMTGEGLSFETAARIPRQEFEKAAGGNSVPRRGDVLFSKDGTVGKVHFVTEGIDFAVLSSIAILRPRIEILDGAFLAHVLRSPRVLQHASNSRTGSALTRIVLKDLKRVRIPLPPLGEQRRIAAVLDKADGIRRKRRESLRLLDEFLRSAFLEMFGDPVKNEKGWEVRSLGEVADFVGGGTPSRAVKAFFTGSVCWATAKDIQGEFLTDTQEHITQEAIDKSATKLVTPGTILIVVKSKVLMHRLPVAIAQVPTCFGQDLKGIVARDGISATYVARHLRIGEQWLLSKARGANTEGLTLDHLRRLPLMLPPPEQIASYDRLEHTHQATRQAYAEQLAVANVFFDSLAQRAFGGCL